MSAISGRRGPRKGRRVGADAETFPPGVSVGTEEDEPTIFVGNRQITKSGPQLALYIPREVERSMGLKAGTKVVVEATRTEIRIRPEEG
ncbi:MAG: AbrB/MazE/SpoVT family DNA-binding domain-containing protein [Methanobacteriota archaeon]